MADNKSGRDKQADDADRRQRERDVVASLERMDETEPPVDETTLELFETELDSIPFPATGAEVVATVGDETIDSESGSYSVVDLVPDTDEEEFDSPAAVRMRVQRPTIAAAMKQIVEASEGSPHESLADSQREAYEKTFRKLRAIDAVDDDEGIPAIRDWIIEQIHENETLPGSRAVRREAAEFCRSNGYEVRNDEWLGI